jgi:hypothetical protein
MENQEWQEIVDALVEAKRCLASAWQTSTELMVRPPVSNPY